MNLKKTLSDCPALPREPKKFVFYYIKKYRRLLAINLMMVLCAVSVMQFIYFTISRAIDAATNAEGDFSKAYDWITIYFICVLGNQIFWRGGGYFRTKLLPPLLASIRADLFRYLQNHSVDYFLNSLSGRLGHKISQVSRSIEGLYDIVMWGFLFPIVGVTSAAFYLLISAHWIFAVGFLTWVILYSTVTFFYAKRAEKLAEEYADQQSNVSGLMVDSITNILSVKIFAKKFHEFQLLNQKLKEEVRVHTRFRWVLEWMFLNHAFLFYGAAAFFVVYGLYAVDIGLMGIGAYVLLVQYFAQLGNWLVELSFNIIGFYSNMGTIEDGLSLIVRPHEVLDPKNPKPFAVKKGEIKFGDVTFNYKKKSQVFNKLNLVIPAGEKVGLVGHSGAGKSTFTHLILRYYDVEGGSITIDGTDIRSVAQEDLRSQISFIPQDTQLFHRTLRDNIAYARPDASEQEVIAAAKRAHAHEFIMKLPEKYDSLVGERGVKLSGGQRQRIAIARAILENAPILILDEATSALDSESEVCIQESLKTLMKGKTVIAIAHRLSTLKIMDRLLVFEDGKIVEDGTHTSLLRKKGVYHNLWTLQSGEFIKDV